MIQTTIVKPVRLDQLTSLRFFAAMMIVLHHSQHYFGIEGAGFNLGQGVSFFFVLSGFILTYVYPSFDSRRSVKQFLRARIARIWPAYVFAFLFAFWFVPFDWRPATGLVNLLMLQAWLPVSKYYFSYNAASWSVSTEFFFYLAFPFLIHKWDRTWGIKVGASVAILLVLFAVSNKLKLPAYGDPAVSSNGMWVTQHGLIYINPLSRIFEFIVGMVVATVSKSGVKLGFIKATAAEVFSVMVCALSICFGGYLVSLADSSVLGPAAGQWSIHSGSLWAFALLIFVMARGEGAVSRILNLRPFVFLGEISFSLYLLHQTVLTVIQRTPLSDQLPGWACWIVFFVATIGLSCLVWLIVEIPGRRLLNGGGISHGTRFMADLLSGEMMRSYEKRNVDGVLLRIVAVGCVVYAAYIAMRYATQSPLDAYSFRQSQTALSAYWLMLNGFSFSYETPVAGPAWSIPFEFPFYQYLAAVIAGITGFSLDAIGRLLSFVFLILCLLPVKSITQKLRLPESVFYIFTAILFSTPLYVYWGRSFMIETAALFFSIAAIKYFIDLLVDGVSRRAALLYITFITLGILQKATTALPVLLVLSIVFFAVETKRAGSLGGFVFSGRSLKGAIYFGIPLVFGVAWTQYTDHMKSLNSLGTYLTSSALSEWNWGTLQQRLSSDLYVKVLWERVFKKNLAGLFGIALLLLAIFSKAEIRIKSIVVGALTIGIVPFFLFTNLHIVHEYYQSANLIYLIFAVAVALGGVLGPVLGAKVLAPSLILVLVSNYLAFSAGYLNQAKAVFTRAGSRDYSIGEILKREVPAEKQFVAFGNDWSSTFAYISQRKSFNVPGWYKSIGEVAAHPERFVDEARLGAVVACSSTKPSLADLLDWSISERAWKIGEAHGCYVATPEKSMKFEGPSDHGRCEGSIDRSVVELRDGAKIISLAGWTTMAEGRGIVPDEVFFTLSKPGAKTLYLEALKVPRADVNAHLGLPDDVDSGLSRIAISNLAPGEYVVGVTQAKGGRIEACQFQAQLVIDGSI